MCFTIKLTLVYVISPLGDLLCNRRVGGIQPKQLNNDLLLFLMCLSKLSHSYCVQEIAPKATKNV